MAVQVKGDSVSVRSPNSSDEGAARAQAQPASKPGMGDSDSSLKSVDLHSSRGAATPDVHEAEGDDAEASERACSCLSCLDLFLPTSLVDCLDQLCETVYNCIAAIFGWERGESVETTVNSIQTRISGSDILKVLRTAHGDYRVHGDLSDHDPWLGMSIKITKDEQTEKDGTLLCVMIKTGESLRVSWLLPNQSIDLEGSAEAALKQPKIISYQARVTSIEPGHVKLVRIIYENDFIYDCDLMSASDVAWDANWVNARIRITSRDDTTTAQNWNVVNLDTQECAVFHNIRVHHKA